MLSSHPIRGAMNDTQINGRRVRLHFALVDGSAGDERVRARSASVRLRVRWTGDVGEQHRSASVCDLPVTLQVSAGGAVMLRFHREHFYICTNLLD